MAKRIAAWTASAAVAFLIMLVGRSVLLAQRSERSERRAVLMDDDGNQTLFLDHDGARAWMGVTIKDVTANDAHEMKLPGDYGAVVTDVAKDSPAAKAGIEKNDVIVRYAGERVWSMAQLLRWVHDTPPGRAVEVELSRNGQTRMVNVTLEEHERSFGALAPFAPRVEIPNVKIPDMHFYFGMGAPRLGISAAELTPQLAAYFGVQEGKGVLVREVTTGSAAEKAGLKAGDCIVRLNLTAVDSVESLQQALSKLFEGSTKSSDEKRQATVTFVRDRREQTVNVEIANPTEHWPEFSEEARNARLSADEYQPLARELQSQVTADEYQRMASELRDRAMAEAKQAQDETQQLQKMRADLMKQAESLKNNTALERMQRQLQDLRQQLRYVDGII